MYSYIVCGWGGSGPVKWEILSIYDQSDAKIIHSQYFLTYSTHIGIVSLG